jgi:hypothetical protein
LARNIDAAGANADGIRLEQRKGLPSHAAASADANTRSSAIAIDKLECVDEEEKERQTLRVRRAERERQQAAWEQAPGVITSALSAFRRTGRLDPSVSSSLRAIERAAEGVGRKLR